MVVKLAAALHNKDAIMVSKLPSLHLLGGNCAGCSAKAVHSAETWQASHGFQPRLSVMMVVVFLLILDDHLLSNYTASPTSTLDLTLFIHVQGDEMRSLLIAWIRSSINPLQKNDNAFRCGAERVFGLSTSMRQFRCIRSSSNFVDHNGRKGCSPKTSQGNRNPTEAAVFCCRIFPFSQPGTVIIKKKNWVEKRCWELQIRIDCLLTQNSLCCFTFWHFLLFSFFLSFFLFQKKKKKMKINKQATKNKRTSWTFSLLTCFSAPETTTTGRQSPAMWTDQPTPSAVSHHGRREHGRGQERSLRK